MKRVPNPFGKEGAEEKSGKFRTWCHLILISLWGQLYLNKIRGKVVLSSCFLKKKKRLWRLGKKKKQEEE